MFDLVHEKHHVMFVLSEEVFSDLIVYNNFATSIQCVYIYICIYIYIYQINSSLQVDTDVSRVPDDIGNMVVAYAIAICCINTSRRMCV